jgi:hypothetical protein
MIRLRSASVAIKAAALAAAGLAIGLGGPAQAVEKPTPHARHVAHYAPPAGEVVVRTGRSLYSQPYPVDPYQDFLAGPRYYVDTALDDEPALTNTFGGGALGQSVLPSRFNPPGQEPLFRF